MTVSDDHLLLGGTVLIVEEDQAKIKNFERMLHAHSYVVKKVSTGKAALESLKSSPADVVILGGMDSGLDGIEVCQQIREDPRLARLPVIFATTHADRSYRIEAKSVGADDFLVDPVDEIELAVRVRNLVLVRRYHQHLEQERASLMRTVEEQTELLGKAMAEIGRAQKALRRFNEEIIVRLSKAVEYRDDEIGNHVQRMSRYCGLIAAKMGMNPEMCDAIRVASALHDVGKIAIPDEVLRKPARLTEQEMSVMRQHTDKGYEMLMGSESSLLELAATVARSHHERFDGAGYPQGLKGKDIPFEGRIAAVADVFDALTSRRVYKPSFPVSKAKDILIRERGAAFDPVIVDSFFDSFDDVRNIMIVYADR